MLLLFFRVRGMLISPEVRNAIHVGDRILEINGLPVATLMEQEVSLHIISDTYGVISEVIHPKPISFIVNAIPWVHVVMQLLHIWFLTFFPFLDHLCISWEPKVCNDCTYRLIPTISAFLCSTGRFLFDIFVIVKDNENIRIEFYQTNKIMH